YCVCWANENWSRRWDGSDDALLIAQQHSAIDDENLIRSLLSHFRDSRYIRVDGRPLFLVYRADLLPDPVATAQQWRLICTQEGVADPFLVAAQSFGLSDPRPYGFDAAVQFPPHGCAARDITDSIQHRKEGFVGRVFDYAEQARHEAARAATEYMSFRCVMPSWDNTPRRPTAGTVYVGSTPALYEQWLRASVASAQRELPQTHRFVFINAWNEWGEGAYLEPDTRYGDAYLRATRAVLGATQGIAQPPLVSVVVATFNRAPLLTQALRSVASQTFDNIELIVVDDGSQDETASVVATFSRRYPQLHTRLIYKQNAGAAAAFNDGIRLAKGDYVALLNDDDRYHPDRLRRLVRSSASGRARFVFTRVDYIDGTGARLSAGHAPSDTFRAKQSAICRYPSASYALLDFNVAISSGNFFFDRRLFDEAGGFASLRYCHDWDWALRAARHTDPLFLDEPLYEYRFHSNNASAHLRGEGDADSDAVLSKFFEYDDDRGDLPCGYPCRLNFGDYHDRFVLDHGYDRYRVAPLVASEARRLA
ncbi:MAG: glycoside hydrolase family 99-like domain-containing protein, partial [Candidatus Eremiobacteraeota bacterium]|nr:glycoside hydrolase family 99-like domain-containing protein [Candidatus Eremiobacteraeota bacterium]